ncbi:hypothetical protein KY290_003470 [Solanum tuberosum]|uniref:Uncharacterized protein n=1 Tax=Solanum tuberosum TaxID=4113 RepID=A0ABQ7WV69_SOLTU|nr:hypothetical protein KY289_003808 [Solanum tuberosum]KAH0783872.1 hypothetical protein KY290_003470 [Solanum tuberosum]
MEKEKNRDHNNIIPRSPVNTPRLLRSKSGMSLPEIHKIDYVPPKHVNRSKSTTKMRSNSRGEENVSPLRMIKNNKKFQEIEDHHNHSTFAKFLQKRDNGSKSSTTTTTATTTCVSTNNNSRSAWALSPGRPLPIVPKSPSSRKLKMDTSKDVSDSGGDRGGVTSVLKLVQWRFVNARVEASMAAIKRVAQAKVMSIYDAMISAEEVMDGIQDFIMNMQWQVEEETLRVHCIQLAKERTTRWEGA